MRDKFKNLAERLIKNDNPESIYKELANIFDSLCLFHEQGACIEKLWHVTQDPNLYKEVADIFLYKVRNRNIAFEGYNRYLQYSQPEFYKSFSENLLALGYDKFQISDDEDYKRNIIRLSDSFDCVIYMMKALHKLKDYEGVMEMEQYLNSFDEKIKNYIQLHPLEKPDCVDENTNGKKHLSGILSETLNHNDINKLAIRLDSGNEKAYINIIGDMLTYGRLNDAVDYYNNVYAEKFGKITTNNIVNICWIVSDFYRDRYEFYNAVFYQKIALEQEVQG